MLATDDGHPVLTSELATLTISVTRNRFAPTFVNEPYIFNITQSEVLGEIGLISVRDEDTVVCNNLGTMIREGASWMTSNWVKLSIRHSESKNYVIFTNICETYSPNCVRVNCMVLSLRGGCMFS